MTSELERGKNRRAKPQRAAAPRGRQAPSVEFINRELREAEVKAFRLWREDGATVLAFWDELCEDGYKTSVKFDDYSSSYAAFVFPPDDSDNDGFCLTGRGGTAYRALAEALYKHFVLFGKQWSNDGRSPDVADDPDW